MAAIWGLAGNEDQLLEEVHTSEGRSWLGVFHSTLQNRCKASNILHQAVVAPTDGVLLSDA